MPSQTCIMNKKRSKTKKAAQWVLYTILAIAVVFLVDGLWTRYLQKEIAPQIQTHFAPIADVYGSSADTSGFYNALNQIVEGKSILGFGEATHGTAEFEQAFSLISRQLISKKGFNVVVFAEMNFADTWALNNYVLHGKAVSMAGQNTPYGFLQEDRLKLIEWIYAYNKDKPLYEKVWLLGADVTSPNEAARNALIYCDNYKIDLPAETRNMLTALTHVPLYSKSQAIRDNSSLEDILSKIAPLYRLVQQNSSRQDSLDLRQLWLAQSVSNLNGAIRSFYAPSHREDPFRDSTMYRNIKWVMGRKPGAKILVYAHNVHIEKTVGYKDISPDVPRLGWHLNQNHKEQFAVIGTEAWKGKYIYSEKEDLATISEKESKVGTAIARATVAPAGLLILNETAELAQFFNRGHTISIGIASPASMYSRTETLAKAYDAIFYVRESTPLKVTALYGFNLKLELSKEEHGNVLNGNTLTLSCATVCSTLDTYQPNKGVELHVAYLDENHELINYNAIKLSPETKIEQTFILPEETVYTELSFAGNKVSRFSLSDFTINGIPVQEQDLKLDGKRYRKSFNKKDNLSASAPAVIQVSLIP